MQSDVVGPWPFRVARIEPEPLPAALTCGQPLAVFLQKTADRTAGKRRQSVGGQAGRGRRRPRRSAPGLRHPTVGQGAAEGQPMSARPNRRGTPRPRRRPTCLHKKSSENQRFSELWWTRSDSNRRPPQCECDALPKETILCQRRILKYA